MLESQTLVKKMLMVMEREMFVTKMLTMMELIMFLITVQMLPILLKLTQMETLSVMSVTIVWTSQIQAKKTLTGKILALAIKM